MQNTRLNALVNTALQQLDRWFSNPWRRLSLLVIGLLFGFFLGTALSTIAGQRANQDIFAAAILLIAGEFVNWLVYRPREERSRSLFLETLNSLKLGITYSLFVEAFKLGS